MRRLGDMHGLESESLDFSDVYRVKPKPFHASGAHRGARPKDPSSRQTWELELGQLQRLTQAQSPRW